MILSGCSVPSCCVSYGFKDGKGTIHYLILGFGLVTVPKLDKETAVIATRVHALGISISDQPGLKLAIGYSASNSVSVADGAEDVRVEISQVPGGSLEIETQSAKLTNKRAKIDGGL
jgi:hypothetical protein